MALHPASTATGDAAGLVPPGGLVVAVTDDGSDPRYGAVREAATRLARAARGKVLLFYGPPGWGMAGPVRPRMFFPAVPGRDGATVRSHTGSRRRDLLRAEAAAIRAHGIDVAVWLPGRSGADGMAEAVALTHAAILLLPAEPDRPGVVRRTLHYHATRIPAPIVAVDPSGRLAPIEPLGGRRPAEGSSLELPDGRHVLGPVAAGSARVRAWARLSVEEATAG